MACIIRNDGPDSVFSVTVTFKTEELRTMEVGNFTRTHYPSDGIKSGEYIGVVFPLSINDTSANFLLLDYSIETKNIEP